MNPLEIFSVILPIIEQLPTVEASVSALIKAVEGMVAGGHDPLSILKDVLGIIPAVSQAVVANTPQATTGPTQEPAAAVTQ